MFHPQKTRQIEDMIIFFSPKWILAIGVERGDKNGLQSSET